LNRLTAGKLPARKQIQHRLASRGGEAGELFGRVAAVSSQTLSGGIMGRRSSLPKRFAPILFCLLLVGRATAYVPDAYQPNYNEGYGVGYTSGYNTGYTSGSERGTKEGTTKGNSDGYQVGWDAAYQPAYDAAYQANVPVGQAAGFDAGLPVGLRLGDADLWEHQQFWQLDHKLQ